MPRAVRIIGAPTDYGANRRGVDMGPSAMRYAGLADRIEEAGVTCTDAGNVPVPLVEAAERAGAVAGPRFLEETREATGALTDEVAETLAAGSFPLVLGGDHSVAIGTMAGAAQEASLGVVWLDAHGDFNTPETSPSGNVHGMALAASLGRGGFADEPWAHADGLLEANVVWVGLRDLDEAEAEAVRDSAAMTYTIADVDERGIVDVIQAAVDVASDGVDGVHLSLDMDWLDPHEAPGVGTPVRGGVTYREAHAALEAVAERDAAAGGELLRSMDVVEVNPILDSRNETAELAAELAASALGKRIL